MNEFKEGVEKEPTFDDMVRLAREIKDKNLLPDVQEIYIAESGKFNVRMKKPYSDEFYREQEIKLRSIQNGYNQIRADITNEFDHLDANYWNGTPIGIALRRTSELFTRQLDCLSNRKPFDSAEYLYVLDAMDSFGQLLMDSDFKKSSKDKKLEALNEGAIKFLNQLRSNALYRTYSRLVQQCLLAAERDDAVGIELRKALSSSKITAMYPLLKEFAFKSAN